MAKSTSKNEFFETNLKCKLRKILKNIKSQICINVQSNNPRTSG